MALLTVKRCAYYVLTVATVHRTIKLSLLKVQSKRLSVYLFVVVFACLFIGMIFQSKKVSKLTQEDMNGKLATTNLSHTDIGLTSMITNCTNQEIVIQPL